MENKSCLECKYCVCKDYGYSNYTVEGTEIYCLLNMNPKFPVDRFYGEEPELLFASQCERFKEGGCVEIDVEVELLNYKDKLNDISYSVYSNDEEIKKLLNNYKF